MGRGSLVGRRAMSGQVKKTDRENGGKCVFRGQKERVEGAERDGEWGGNGCIAENGSVMS